MNDKRDTKPADPMASDPMKADPMKPAPPVTKIRIPSTPAKAATHASLAAEGAVQS